MLCKICNAELKENAARHFRVHGITSLEYYERYESEIYGLSIVKMYNEEKKSANKIAKIIRKEVSWLNPTKKLMLSFLSSREDVTIRSTSEAIKEWSKQQGGPWNKGLTKEDHPSIMAYSEKMWVGENNPSRKYYQKHGHYINPWEGKNEEEKREYKRKILETTIKRKRDRNIPIRESVNENKIGKFLSKNGIQYIKQYIVGHYNYDYLIKDEKLLIEYNGSYWHCDPRIYDENYIHPHTTRTAKEIWEKDTKKTSVATENDYSIITIWEYDVEKLNEKQFEEYVIEAIKNKIYTKN